MNIFDSLQAKFPWQKTAEERLEIARINKERGTELFKVTAHAILSFTNSVFEIARSIFVQSQNTAFVEFCNKTKSGMVMYLKRYYCSLGVSNVST